MTNAHSFPLLHLPSLALQDVINQMLVREQFHLGGLSRRAKWVVRTSTSRRKFVVKLAFDIIFSIEITNETLSQSHKFELGEVFTAPSDAELKVLIAKLSGLFKTLRVKLYISDDSPWILDMIPAIKQINGLLDKIHVEFGCPNDNLCQLALTAGTFTYNLFISCVTTPDFKPHVVEVFELEHLELCHASWLTRDLLVNHFINCRNVEMMHSNFPSRDVNDFLKKWMEASKMKNFCSWPTFELFTGDNLPKPLNGIPCAAVKKGRIRCDKFVRPVNGNDDCFLIEQVGGVKAIVWKEGTKILMSTEFTLD